MADAPQIHPLRQRMIEDMTPRGVNSASQKTYLRRVRACCAYVGRRPAHDLRERPYDISARFTQELPVQPRPSDRAIRAGNCLSLTVGRTAQIHPYCTSAPAIA
jgi:hypothetical protein